MPLHAEHDSIFGSNTASTYPPQLGQYLPVLISPQQYVDKELLGVKAGLLPVPAQTLHFKSLPHLLQKLSPLYRIVDPPYFAFTFTYYGLQLVHFMQSPDAEYSLQHPGYIVEAVQYACCVITAFFVRARGANMVPRICRYCLSCSAQARHDNLLVMYLISKCLA